jgi:glycerol uptake facilitator-like aquaporin
MDLCDGTSIMANLFLAEFLGTFLFINIILSIKFHNGANDLVVNALSIGLTLFLCVILIGGISGGSLNPAVGLV